jgi:X-Pro dipeptidyl-peptidase
MRRCGVRLRASVDQAQTNLGAILVDYGAATHQTRSGDGVRTSTTSTCWGESSADDDPCYFEVTKPLVGVTSWNVAKAILASSNRDSLVTAQPLVPGEGYDFDITVLPTDYVFPAGHQIGVIVVGSYRQFPSIVNQNRANITADEKHSTVTLPIVGGSATVIPNGPSSAQAAPALKAARESDGGWAAARPQGVEIPR